MSSVTPNTSSTSESVRPQVTERQRRVLDKIREVYLETGDWPTHVYLEQELEDEGIELDEELRGMPSWVFYPDNRFHGGVLYFQEHEKVQLMLRGLVACSDADREIRMLVASIKWAVSARKSVRQLPHEVVQKRWRASDAMAAMQEILYPDALPAWSCKLVLEVLRMEPVDLPRWGGQPDGFPEWEIDIPTGVKRFRNVESIDDYLAETAPQVPKRTPHQSVSSVSQLLEVAETSFEVVEHPIFERLVRKKEMFECFVLLPLREPFKAVYAEAVAPVAEELGITCGHAASIFGPGRIMKDIISSITFAEVIVAELTGRNPNVFYELGVAHQQGKQVVLLSQDIDDVPFDLRDMRVVEYTWNGAESEAEKLRRDLRPNLEQALHAARAARV